MITLGLIGLWILTIMFFVWRGQNMQRELSQVKFALKTLQSQTKFSLDSNMLIAKQLQHSYKLKLENLRRNGLLHSDELLIMQFFIDNVVFVVSQCCEHGATLEESLEQALDGIPLDMSKVQQFMGQQSAEVLAPWSKKTLEGFLAACKNLLSEKLSVAETTLENEQAKMTQ